jgi:hypothetical protein
MDVLRSAKRAMIEADEKMKASTGFIAVDSRHLGAARVYLPEQGAAFLLGIPG